MAKRTRRLLDLASRRQRRRALPLQETKRANCRRNTGSSPLRLARARSTSNHKCSLRARHRRHDRIRRGGMMKVNYSNRGLSIEEKKLRKEFNDKIKPLQDQSQKYERDLENRNHRYHNNESERTWAINRNNEIREQIVKLTDKFEHEFEKCISKTAVQTKFEQHTNRGKEIITLLRETTANIANRSQTCKEESVKKLQEMDEKSNVLEHELRSMTESTKEKIRHVTEDVYKRVAQTLNDEIKR